MNNKQRWVVVLGFVVILLLGLFPPWLLVHYTFAEKPNCRITDR